jgi:LacI family transcriptional regulator
MSTIKDVAKLAGVGVGTVSRVLNQHPNVSADTRARVEQAIQKLRFKPNEAARRMKMAKTQEVALALPHLLSPFLSKLAAQIEQELFQRNYRMLYSSNYADAAHERTYLDMLQKHQIAGLIGITYNDVEWLVEAGLPMVSIDRFIDYSVPCVAADNFVGGEMACRALVEKGCRHVAFLGDRPQSYSFVADRLRGFQGEAGRQGVACAVYDKETVANIHEDRAFIEASLLAMRDAGVDGLFCINDRLALAVYAIAQRHGIRVPEQLRIIGFDGYRESPYFHPILSTIEQPVAEIARIAVDLLIQKIENPAFAPVPQVVPVTYREGKTT